MSFKSLNILFEKKTSSGGFCSRAGLYFNNSILGNASFLTPVPSLRFIFIIKVAELLGSTGTTGLEGLNF